MPLLPSLKSTLKNIFSVCIYMFCVTGLITSLPVDVIVRRRVLRGGDRGEHPHFSRGIVIGFSRLWGGAPSRPLSLSRPTGTVPVPKFCRCPRKFSINLILAVYFGEPWGKSYSNANLKRKSENCKYQIRMQRLPTGL